MLKVKVLAEVNEPIRPDTVMTGIQIGKSGTLNVTFTVIVLLSQGYGEL